MPTNFSRAFVHAREYALFENEYRNGESQRGLLISTSRKRWRLGKRLTPALLQQLRNFYDAREGSQEPLYFYDPMKPLRAFPTIRPGPCLIAPTS